MTTTDHAPAPPADTAAPDAGAAGWAILEERAAENEGGKEAAQEGAQAPEGGAAPMDWGFASAGLVGAFAVYADAWALTDDEQSNIASHLAAALAAWFPDVRMDGRWQAAGALVMVLGGVAVSRRDPATGRIRPLRRKAEGQADAGQGPSSATDTAGLALRPAGL